MKFKKGIKRYYNVNYTTQPIPDKHKQVRKQTLTRCIEKPEKFVENYSQGCHKKYGVIFRSSCKNRKQKEEIIFWSYETFIEKKIFLYGKKHIQRRIMFYFIVLWLSRYVYFFDFLKILVSVRLSSVWNCWLNGIVDRRVSLLKRTAHYVNSSLHETLSKTFTRVFSRGN